MKFAMIGLGKMGLNLVKNSADNGHEVVAFDLNADFVKEAATYSDKVSPATDLDDMLAQLPSPKVVWVMVPAGVPTNATIDTLIEKLAAGDIIIDGGNSNYKDNLGKTSALLLPELSSSMQVLQAVCLVHVTVETS